MRRALYDTRTYWPRIQSFFNLGMDARIERTEALSKLYAESQRCLACDTVSQIDNSIDLTNLKNNAITVKPICNFNVNFKESKNRIGSSNFERTRESTVS